MGLARYIFFNRKVNLNNIFFEVKRCITSINVQIVIVSGPIRIIQQEEIVCD